MYPVNQTQEMRDYLEERLAGKKAKRPFARKMSRIREIIEAINVR
jgi:hypothetical protein